MSDRSKIHHLRPADVEQLNMGVILTGYLGKMKKHHNDQFQRRFVVLTYRALHWFEREDGYDLFGKEQNHIEVCDIVKCEASEEDKKQFEVVSKDGFLRRFDAEDGAAADRWISAVQRVMDDMAHGVMHRLSISDIDNTGILADPFVFSRASISLVSAQATDKDGQPFGCELVLSKELAFDIELNIPHLGEHQTLNVLMSDGSVTSITFEHLKEAAQEGGIITRKLVGNSLTGELDLEVVAGKPEKKAVGVKEILAAMAETILGRQVAQVYSMEGETSAILLQGTPLALLAIIYVVFTAVRFANDEIPAVVFTLGLPLALFALSGGKIGGTTVKRPWKVTFKAHRILSPDEEGENEIPTQFIEGCPPLAEASRRWEITSKWRKSDDIDNILNEPQPNFDNIKRYYPHFCCGRARDGDLVYYEQVGAIQLQSLKDMGLSIDELVRHYVFTTEFMWRMTHPRSGGRVLTVFDVEGVALSDLAGDAKQFLLKSMGLVQNHYPERSKKILIVNAPGWFSIIWKAIRGWINEETRKKISILTSSETLSGIMELVDESQIPACYGGKLEIGDGSNNAMRFYSPQEIDMRKYVHLLNKRGGSDSTQVTMPPPGLPKGGKEPLGERESKGHKIILAADLPGEYLKASYDYPNKPWEMDGPAGLPPLVDAHAEGAEGTPAKVDPPPPMTKPYASTGNIARKSVNGAGVGGLNAERALRSHSDTPVVDPWQDRPPSLHERKLSLIDGEMDHPVYRRPGTD